MKLSDLKELVNRLITRDDPEVVIKIKYPFTTIGGTPSVPVKYISSGFDWDKGKLIIIPTEVLSKPDEKFHRQFKELLEKHARLDLENRNLKSEIKKLKKELN